MNTLRTALALAAALVPAAALAQAQPVTLSSEASVERPSTVGGVEKMVKVSATGHLAPGDRVTFTFAYHNVSAKPVDHFVITDPLPGGLVLAADGPAAYQVSVDGGRSWGPLAAATVADGKGGRRPALDTDVTHVRWTVPVIAPGAAGTVSFHALVK